MKGYRFLAIRKRIVLMVVLAIALVLASGCAGGRLTVNSTQSPGQTNPGGQTTTVGKATTARDANGIQQTTTARQTYATTDPAQATGHFSTQPVLTVSSAFQQFVLDPFPVWSLDLKSNVIADFRWRTPQEMAGHIPYLTMDRLKDGVVPFRVYFDGREISGSYTLYDECLQSIPFPQRPGQPPQTDIFANAGPGQYMVVLTFTVETATTRTAYQSFFGFILPNQAATTKNTTDETTAAKPVIYLYPQETTDVRVRLDYAGRLTCTYPAYRDGWHVTASPDGTLVNRADGRTYSYLFWEGVDRTQYDFSRGFVVAGKDTAAFLQEKLALLGLTPREYNEFIVYWLPLMHENPYNLITFQDKAYSDNARLTIEPRPDSLLRVFMAYKPLAEPVAIAEPDLKAFERKGFTVVEWGGAYLAE